MNDADAIQTDDNAADETLGQVLDRHLRALETGKQPAGPAETDARALVPVVESLHALAQYLSTTGPRDTGSPPTSDVPCQPSTTDGRPEHQAGLQPRTIGKYEVRRALGRGGQASALLAFDPDLRRHVVLKLYRTCHDEQQAIVLREGQALARVRSPYVAQVFAVERHDETPYLVVEYIAGDNLAERQRKQPADVLAALELLGRLAEGLAAVHACGLLHRDVKPANILIGDDGLPRLVDFGLAAAVASDDLRGLSGTLAYMAPEQARGEVERIDPRSDIFGLGAVFYELLTGKPPYQANDMHRLLELARAGDIVPPAHLKPGIPEPAAALCQRCLAREPSQRFASALELKQALERCRAALTPAARTRLARRGAFAAGLGLLALVGVLVWQAQRPAIQPAGDSTSAKVAPVVPSQPRHPDGRPLRQDFPIKFEVVGAAVDPAGMVRLAEGETVRFQLEAQADCYVGIWYTDDQDNVVELYPNRFAPQQLLRKGEQRLLPADEKYAIRATPSQGREYLHVFASTKEWKPLTLGTRAGPFEAYQVFATPSDREGLQTLLRGLVLEASLPAEAGNDTPRVRVSEAVLQFHVGARTP